LRFYTLPLANFRRKIAECADPKLGQKMITVETMDEISDQICYLLVSSPPACRSARLRSGIYAIGKEQTAVWGAWRLA
jgi:hypothetical protein